MNDNENEMIPLGTNEEEMINFNDLEKKLEEELNNHMEDLKILQDDYDKIENPNSIGEVVGNVVWEQFINQIGVVAGEDFIKENRGLTLDLRDSAHIQTTDNFSKGKIATHNDKIDFQKRYDDWQSNFLHDEKGNVKTHQTRTGKEEATLVAGARKPFDKGRPAGSVERGTDMDHTVSAGEIIRDPAANAHMTKEEQISFANSEKNLNEMDAGQNRSKGDTAMTDWLDNPNKNGQKPHEIFDISEEQDKAYREKDAEAREEYEKRKKEGEQYSIETGKQSQKEEAMRIGGKALRAVLMGLLADLVKDVIRELIIWFRSAEKNIRTFFDSLKQSIKDFFANLKKYLKNSFKTTIDVIMTAIYGPIVKTINKAIIFLKQGYKSFKEAIEYLTNPAHIGEPLSIKLLQVGKIVTAGVAAGGAILLSEVIEKALVNTIPVFAFEIPMLGSLASILGIFFGALVSGIIGALVLRMLDKAIATKQRQINREQKIDKGNKILQILDRYEVVANINTEEVKNNSYKEITSRHEEYKKILSHSLENIKKDEEDSLNKQEENKKELDNINNILNDF